MTLPEPAEWSSLCHLFPRVGDLEPREAAVCQEHIPVVPVQEVLLGSAATEEEPRLAQRRAAQRLLLPLLQEAPAQCPSRLDMERLTAGRSCMAPCMAS